MNRRVESTCCRDINNLYRLGMGRRADRSARKTHAQQTTSMQRGHRRSAHNTHANIIPAYLTHDFSFSPDKRPLLFTKYSHFINSSHFNFIFRLLQRRRALSFTLSQKKTSDRKWGRIPFIPTSSAFLPLNFIPIWSNRTCQRSIDDIQSSTLITNE